MPYQVMQNVYREMAEQGLVAPIRVKQELDRLWAWVVFTAQQPGPDGAQLTHYLNSPDVTQTVYLSHYIHPQMTQYGWQNHFDIRLPTGETRHIYL